jgi:hypothetical protein
VPYLATAVETNSHANPLRVSYEVTTTPADAATWVDMNKERN